MVYAGGMVGEVEKQDGDRRKKGRGRKRGRKGSLDVYRVTV